MNIGITCYSTYGGSGIVGSELGRELARRGHKVHFICSALPTRITELNENIIFHEVELINYPLFEYPPYDLALAVKMYEVAVDKQLDLLHVHYAIPHSISAFLAREMTQELRRLPIVTTLHGTDITLVGADRSYLPITRFGILRSDGVTAVSNYLKRETCQVFDVDAEKLLVIPNFIDPSYYYRRTNQALKGKLAPNGEKLIVHVSNFRPVKRVTDCVRIFAALRARVKARLVMVGDGPERAQAEWLARQLSISKDVLFVGKQPAIVDYLSIADLLLLPSETESFGLSALEAMACEVPVIASNVGGLPEVVVDGETGYLAEVGDVETMAKYAVKILTSDNLHKKMSHFAREIAIEKFSTDKIIPMYLDYYEEVLGRF
ncbi:MAG: N-acetyl-alpha-D-glucosaminyl L-malate synthase BshA [Acidobacteriota bacterium]|nr:N-acetyl-alpha-D-glucosaminyl L-malate synthase BshA [Blastocatellia bacterium]MDW8413289.1 N-acetyl-alpha-D-glucosaminyl L-malate synthase BshA [Acidobacteriota bacterium]